MSVNLGRVAYVEKGAYDSDTTYENKDVVSFNGGSYVFIGDTPAANVPPTNEDIWQPLIDPTAMNNKIAELDDVKEEALTAAATANEKAQGAAAAAADANAAAQRADEARENIRAELNGKAPAIFVDASGDIVTITDGAAMPVQSLVSHIEPLQSGSGDPSPDNVRPISGWDEVGVTGAGKNLLPYLDLSSERNGITFTSNNDGTYVVDGTATADAFYRSNTAPISLGVLPAGQYTMSVSPASAAALVRGRVTNKTSSTTTGTTNGTTGAKTFTADGVSEYGFGFYVPNGKTVANLTVSIQIEHGESATAHEQYQGKTLTAALPETLYGFDKNWTTGLVTVTHAAVILDGTEDIRPNGNSTQHFYAYCIPSDRKAGTSSTDGLCSHYQYGNAYNGLDGTIQARESILWICNSSYGGVDGLKAFLAEQAAAGTPVTVVYKLAEPYTIQLTPQQLETLKGVNNIWSDAGATEVTYAADTKMYIDQKIAAIAAAIVNE